MKYLRLIPLFFLLTACTAYQHDATAVVIVTVCILLALAVPKKSQG